MDAERGSVMGILTTVQRKTIWRDLGMIVGVIQISPRENFLVWSLYFVMYPFAVAAHRLGISANQVSFASIVFSGAAVYFLVSDFPWIVFALLWLLGGLMDFADGMVARLGGKVSKHSFDLDHFLDLIRLLMVSAGLMLFWGNTDVSLLLLVSTQAILIFDGLNQRVSGAPRQDFAKSDSASRLRASPSVKVAYNILGTFHAGHILLISVAPASVTATLTVFGYILIVAVFQTVIAASRLLRTNANS